MSARKVGVLIAVVILAAGTDAVSASATRTRAVIYHAFTSSGAPAFHVKRTVRGKCNGGSLAIARADAWRCFAGNFVYDPCFSASKAKGIVLCPIAPWTSSGVRIKLSVALTGANGRRPSTSGKAVGARDNLRRTVPVGDRRHDGPRSPARQLLLR